MIIDLTQFRNQFLNFQLKSNQIMKFQWLFLFEVIVKKSKGLVKKKIQRLMFPQRLQFLC